MFVHVGGKCIKFFSVKTTLGIFVLTNKKYSKRLHSLNQTDFVCLFCRLGQVIKL